MEFRTIVEIPRNTPPISHQDNLMLMGSCFAENIGSLLTEAGFRCDVNPFGILYNPLSISAALDRMIDGQRYTAADLFFYRGMYHSFMHHGAFSSDEEEECLSRINDRLMHAYQGFGQLDFLLITFGTAWVYRTNNGRLTVSNCHKLPDREFTRERLSVNDITEEYIRLINRLNEINPGLKIIFTVSPIRHIKDGMHENQLSKATLLLAIEELATNYPEQVFYFPSYEIVMDELRDYRFYANDMVHPTETSVLYIWKQFGEAFFDKETKKIIKEYESIRKDINHKPFNPDSEDHKHFLEQIVLKINRFKEKYPNLDVQNDLEICLTRLKK